MVQLTHTCGHCGELVDFQVTHAFDYTPMSAEALSRVRQSTEQRSHHSGMRVTELRPNDDMTFAATVVCPRCRQPSMLTGVGKRAEYEEALKRYAGQNHSAIGALPSLKAASILPRLKEPDSDPAWPGNLVGLFADAQRAVNQGMAASMALGACRTVLEMALKELSADDKKVTLVKRIDALLDAGVITQPIADWAHKVRLEGNDALHDGSGDIADAKEYIEFLRLLQLIAQLAFGFLRLP